ncbi:hypothetical protein [Pseudomonas chlororaphis]|uniref:hypothetical protein n=1 Tax=Pseudomonas chlororaphis TaxID=587753 RepID=UPI000ABDE905|nr:hypothetical protein [Pseudomonas chlororaphis]
MPRIPFKKLMRYITLVSLFICALLLLTLGPSFQQHGLALLTSPSSSLYQSVYKDSLISFPSFKQWISSTNYWLYSIGAGALTFCLYKSRSMRGALILCSVVSFVFMTILDASSFIIYKNITTSNLLSSIASNIVGGPLTSAVLIVTLWSSERLRGSVVEHEKLAEIVSSFLPAIFGLIIFLFQYYALTLFFSPAPSNLEAKTSPKSGASFLFSQEMKARHQKNNTNECECEPEKKSNKEEFRFLKGQFDGDYTFQGSSENANLSWKATSSEEFELSISALDGCLTEDLLNASIDRGKPLKIQNIKNLSVALDKGMVIIGTKAIDGNIDIHQSDIEPSWHLKNEQGHELHRFAEATDTAEYWSNKAALKFSLQLPLLDLNESKATPIERTMKLTANEKTYSLTFKPSDNRTGETPTLCAPFNLSALPLALRTNTSKGGTIKLNIELRQTQKAKTYNFTKQNFFTLTGLNGWHTINRIKAEHIKDLISPGEMQGLIIGGNIDYLRLNGETIKNLHEHEFAFYSGSIIGRADDNGSMIYQGSADWVWVDGKRLSKTRWESLDGATQGILLTLAGLLVIAFARTLHICMRKNDSYNI